MITFTNVKKRFGKQLVLNNINLKLPRFGLVVIQGQSGCGKTTLLNLLSGLLPFEGDIDIDGHHINMMNKNALDEYRLKNYGFIFQDFKLFENESVMNNIIFPLEAVSSSSKETKMRKCLDLINIVGLKKNIKQKVAKLSGGEKQRVAIARALVNNPKIVLADEPTGALDTVTAEEIMKVLEKISSKSLVIVVSHDEDLSKRYADQIIKMKDGKIIKTIYQNKHKEEKYIPVARLLYTEKKPSVPSSFLFNHTINSIRQKKWRTMICNLVTSLGLIGVGLATSLSSSISLNIKKSYAQILDDNKLVISLKNNDKTIYGQYATNYFEANDIATKYKDDIYDIGVTYQNDFESFFPHSNCIAMADINYYHVVEGINIRHVNEFRWLDVETLPTMYPETITYVENDEAVLALTINMIYDICYQLRIERSVTSLSRYLQTTPIKFFFDLRNDDWQYSDQQIFKMVAFTLEKEPGIYHNNHMWNEYMLETRMRFPSEDNISDAAAVPWMLKKIYYLYVNDSNEKFLAKARMDESLEPYLFEIANSYYYPLIFRNIASKDIQRVLIFSNSLSMIPMWYYKYFLDISPDISSPIFGSYGGYSIYPSSMMFGFSNYMFFSADKNSLDDAIDISTTLSVEANENVALPDGVLSGHFSQSISGGVNFAVLKDSPIIGREPRNYSEIVITTKMADSLLVDNPIGSTLHIGFMSSQNLSSDGSIMRQFKTVELMIVGIVEGEKNQMLHQMDWPIGFFQVMLGVSAFDLGISAVMLDVTNDKKMEEIDKNFKRAFPDFDVSNPMSDINDSVNQVCTYIQIALSCFSIIAVVISILLLSICNYLYILENKKDIGLVRCLGVNKKEARKFVITHSVIMCFISFVLSSIELFLSSLLINYEMAKQMGTDFSLSFNTMSLVYMFVLAFSISVFSSLVISYKLNRLDPITALKQ